MIRKLKNIYIIILCIYLAAVLALCLIRTDGLPEIERSFFGLPIDKIVHCLMFIPFPVLSGLVFLKADDNIWKMAVITAVLAVLGAGLAYGTEQLQALTDYRSCDIHDYYADLTGIAAGTAGLTALFLLCRKNLFI